MQTKTKKVYISLPITGYDMKQVRILASSASEFIRNRGFIPISPLDVCPEEGKPYSYYMGKDIEALLECDEVCFCKGWQNSKGCMAEFHIANIYNKKISFI